MVSTSDPGSYDLPSGRAVARPWTATEDLCLRQGVEKYGWNTEQWKAIAAEFVPGRTNKACRKRWLHSLSPSIKKSSWTPEEDHLLLSLYNIHGTRWAVIARSIAGRTDDACSKRYREALDPTLKRDSWNEEEDKALVEFHRKWKGKWSKVGQEMGRSGLGCRNRWRLLERRRLSTRPHIQSRQESSTCSESVWVDTSDWHEIPDMRPLNSDVDNGIPAAHDVPGFEYGVDQEAPLPLNTDPEYHMSHETYQLFSFKSSSLGHALSLETSVMPHHPDSDTNHITTCSTEPHHEIADLEAPAEHAHDDSMSLNLGSDQQYNSDPTPNSLASQFLNTDSCASSIQHSDLPRDLVSHPTPNGAGECGMSPALHDNTPVNPGRAASKTHRLSSKRAIGVDISVLPYACGHSSCWPPNGLSSRSCFATSKGLSDHDKEVHSHDEGHLDRRRFRCGLRHCGKSWKSINGLQYHLQVSKAHFREAISKALGEDNHSIQPNTGNGEKGKPHKCPHSGCVSEYKQLNGLRYHLAHGHPKTPPAQLDALPPSIAAQLHVPPLG